MERKKKTILVTGGAGFIGSHLCERLVKDGHRVISLDNYFTGSKENHISGVEYREGHTKDIAQFVTETPDIIFHLGEYARVEQSILEPEVVHDLNTIGTNGVIQYWRKTKCKLVYAGSSTKFGDGGSTRYTSPYARTKAENSESIRVIGEREVLQHAIAYFYNVYGERERSGVYGTVIEHFKRMYLSGAPCAVVSPGTQERNFTHVDDIVDALILIGESGMGDEYGIGNERSYSILEVSKMFGFQNIVMFPEREGNRMVSKIDTAKTRLLGWNARCKLSSYIEKFTFAHHRAAPKECRVVVFSTTIHPVSGPAERAFLDLAKRLPGVSFLVYAARYNPVVPREASLFPNVSIRTFGLGIPFDKYLLPLSAFRAYRDLSGRNALFAWSLLAGYSAIAGVFLRKLMALPLLVTLADQSVDQLPWVKRIALRFAISRSDQVYGTHNSQEKQVAEITQKKLPRNSMGDGDAFANAIRFAYTDILRRYIGSYS